MARFPTRQAKILDLAKSIAKGLTKSSTTYPNPPVSAKDLQAYLSACKQAIDKAEAVLEEYNQALAVKDEQLAELARLMRRELRYAEYITDFDDDKLKLIGWGARRERVRGRAGKKISTIETQGK